MHQSIFNVIFWRLEKQLLISNTTIIGFFKLFSNYIFLAFFFVSTFYLTQDLLAVGLISDLPFLSNASDFFLFSLFPFFLILKKGKGKAFNKGQGKHTFQKAVKSKHFFYLIKFDRKVILSLSLKEKYKLNRFCKQKFGLFLSLSPWFSLLR